MGLGKTPIDIPESLPELRFRVWSQEAPYQTSPAREGHDRLLWL